MFFDNIDAFYIYYILLIYINLWFRIANVPLKIKKNVSSGYFVVFWVKIGINLKIETIKHLLFTIIKFAETKEEI